MPPKVIADSHPKMTLNLASSASPIKPFYGPPSFKDYTVSLVVVNQDNIRSEAAAATIRVLPIAPPTAVIKGGDVSTCIAWELKQQH